VQVVILTARFIRVIYFFKRNWEKVTGPLERLETSSLLASKNPKKEERYLKVKLDKTLKTDSYYNLDVKGA